MTTEKEIADLFNKILKEHYEQVKTVAHEENSQEHQQPYELLNKETKKMIDMCLSFLIKLYGEYIKPEGAHIENGLEFIPLMGAYGAWIGAQLGVSLDEYYKIVEYYLTRFNLLEENQNENETQRNTQKQIRQND